MPGALKWSTWTDCGVDKVLAIPVDASGAAGGNGLADHEQGGAVFGLVGLRSEGWTARWQRQVAHGRPTRQGWPGSVREACVRVALARMINLSGQFVVSDKPGRSPAAPGLFPLSASSMAGIGLPHDLLIHLTRE